MTKEEKEDFLKYGPPLWKRLFESTVVAAFYTILVSGTVGGAVTFALIFCEDDPWPTAVFLSVILLLCVRAFWMYDDRDYDFDDY